MRRAKVFSIPPGLSFLSTLGDAILAGRFGAPIDPGDPAALAQVTILLPTRRAARALRQIFVARSAGRAVILPRIRTIGDVDEEEHLLQDSPEQAAEALMLPPAISRLERSVALTRLVLAWGRAAGRATLATDPDAPLVVPASAADGMRLAADLARLIDDMGTAGIPWSRLETLVPDDYPGYWQLTLDFLRIAAEAWPAVLAESHVADPAARRDQLLRAEAERLLRSSPPGPFVAAGSTGSMPATAALLKAIASVENGAIVLPGLDRELAEDAWQRIGDIADPNAGAASHPQFALKRLIDTIGIARADVEELGTPAAAGLERARIVSAALRPAEATDKWAESGSPRPGSLDGIGVLVARNEQEEALAIAVALREAIETEGAVAALVTPDRTLARRVAVELGRWAVRVDDSAGQPLDATLPGVFALAIAEAAISADPVDLLAAAKHPLAGFGMNRVFCRRAARALEVALLRGPGKGGTIAGLPAQIANTRLAMEMRAERFTPRARRRLTRFDWTMAERMAAAFAQILGPLEELTRRPMTNAAEATRLLAAALDLAADDGNEGAAGLWAGPAGTALASLLAGLLPAAALEMPAREYPAFLKTAMAGVSVTPTAGADPRIHIWGTLEARLQSVDLLILGGLDEGVWPAEARSDAWLSRRMRRDLGLPPPERRIGLAAHDFAQALGHERVIVTRAEKRAGAPTVPSRWLQRLAALLGPERWKELVGRGDRHLALARMVDAVPPSEVRPVGRPRPRPPVAARPRDLSITAIETLIRDPYAIYARRILQLEPLDPIGQRADPRLRGTLIHDALANFTKGWTAAYDDTARARLLALWREQFEEIKAYPEVHAVWSLLADRIVDWIVDWERERTPRIAERQAEIKGEYGFAAPGGPFKLTGRADRIDIFTDGSIGIYDYKTGAPPSARQVLPFQPQLALEGAMAAAGAFGPAFANRPVAELAWIGLARIGKDDPLRSAVDDNWTAETVAAEAMARLKRLIAAYDDEEQGYASQARPMFERRWPGDFDHLARVAEWRLIGGGS